MTLQTSSKGQRSWLFFSPFLTAFRGLKKVTINCLRIAVSLLFITFLLIALVMLLCLVSPLMPSSVHSIVHTYTQTLSCLYTSDNPDNKRHPFLFFFSSLPFLHDLKKKMCFWIKERVCDLFCVMCKCCVSGLERKALKGFNAYQKRASFHNLVI